ncbi:hypothetical protein WOLCODRAFT_135995 [Wolfiporia cocos MD-104 SS10]|uniref:Uncharacterized protein n=1 Tax=Wolfiporia cocos (strain MD-104) TaxID=742152 RepID=A0A2H3J7U9_WOLCO|nr:hypothetical protein WOLCODRAFT_135995 [Wolfiporia cocos MD-104 SS10]
MNATSGQHNSSQDQAFGEHAVRPDAPRRTGTSPLLPDLDLPQSDLDLSLTFESILAEPAKQEPEDPEVKKMQKRASNVLKLTQENEKLQAELRAMSERLEAAERRQKELNQRAAARSQERNISS